MFVLGKQTPLVGLQCSKQPLFAAMSVHAVGLSSRLLASHHYSPTPINEEEKAVVAALSEPPMEALRRLKTVATTTSSHSTLRSPTFCFSNQFHIHLVFQLDRGNVAAHAHHIEAQPCHLCTNPICFFRQSFHGCHPLSNVNCIPLDQFKHFFIPFILTNTWSAIQATSFPDWSKNQTFKRNNTNVAENWVVNARWTEKKQSGSHVMQFTKRCLFIQTHVWSKVQLT